MGRRKGFTVSEDIRAKISAAKKGKPLTSDHRAAMSASRIGKPKSTETRFKISLALSKVKPRRPLDEANPEGYQESDSDYVANNLALAVKLLDWARKQKTR